MSRNVHFFCSCCHYNSCCCRCNCCYYCWTRQWKSFLMPTKADELRCDDAVPNSQYFFVIADPCVFSSSFLPNQPSKNQTQCRRKADAILSIIRSHCLRMRVPLPPQLPNFKKQTRSRLMVYLLSKGFITCAFPLSMSFCAELACCLPTWTTVTTDQCLCKLHTTLDLAQSGMPRCRFDLQVWGAAGRRLCSAYCPRPSSSLCALAAARPVARGSEWRLGPAARGKAGRRIYAPGPAEARNAPPARMGGHAPVSGAGSGGPARPVRYGEGRGGGAPSKCRKTTADPAAWGASQSSRDELAHVADASTRLPDQAPVSTVPLRAARPPAPLGQPPLPP